MILTGRITKNTWKPLNRHVTNPSALRIDEFVGVLEMLSSDQLSDLIRKRFEVDPTLADSLSQGYSDGSGDFGTECF